MNWNLGSLSQYTMPIPIWQNAWNGVLSMFDGPCVCFDYDSIRDRLPRRCRPHLRDVLYQIVELGYVVRAIQRDSSGKYKVNYRSPMQWDVELLARRIRFMQNLLLRRE